MKIKTLVLSVATAATTVGLLIGPAGVASAAVVGPPLPNPSYGFDGNAHLVVGGGSTTLYKIAQGFTNIWDSSAGCFTNNATVDPAATPQSYPQTGAGAFNQCTPAGATQTYNGVNAGGNFDGDTLAVASSVGSGTGIAALNGYDGAAGTFAYEGTNQNLTTINDPNGQHMPTYGVARTDTGITLTNGSSSFPDASAVATDVGQPVTSGVSGFPAGATVVSVVSGTVTISAPFTGTTTNTGSVTFPNAVDTQPPGNQVSNGYGTPDFAISSRSAKLTKGNCSLSGSGGTNDELACDTFWGVAADGVQVFSFDSSDGTFGNPGLTGTDIYNIWECNYTTWGQLPEYSTLVNPPPSTAPIVPWSMNTGSGTYADFNGYVAAGDGGLAFTADDKKGTYGPLSSQNPSPTTAGQCDRELSPGTLPLENDVKPLLQDVEQNYNGGAGITTTNAMSTNNPANWLWFGSNGLMSAYTYLSNPSLFGTQFNSAEVPLSGIKPTSLTIGGNATGTVHATYPAQRSLSVVTRLSDADCPVPVAGIGCNFNNVHTDSVTLTGGSNTFTDPSATPADVGVEITSTATGFPAPATVLSVSGSNVTISAPFTGATGAASVTYAFGPLDGNGTTNLNVVGPTSGKGGALREFVRLLCSTSAENTAVDPYTGASLVSEVGAVITGSGFTLPPIHSNESTSFNRTPNSDCDVQSEK